MACDCLFHWRLASSVTYENLYSQNEADGYATGDEMMEGDVRTRPNTGRRIVTSTYLGKFHVRNNYHSTSTDMTISPDAVALRKFISQTLLTWRFISAE